MTRRHLTTAAALALALAGAGPAAAQSPMAGRSMVEPHGIDMAGIDGDGDGALSRDELLSRASGRLSEADADADGGLDRTELIVAMPGPRPGIAAVFAVDPAEVRADRLLAMMGASESGRVEIAALAERRVNDLFALLDEDRDGTISGVEVAAMRDHARGRERRRGHGRGHRGDGPHADHGTGTAGPAGSPPPDAASDN